MSEASVPDQFESTAEKLVAFAGYKDHNVDTDNPIDDWYQLRQLDVHTQPTLDGMGQVAFDRAYGAVPGIDQDFAAPWGSNDDQRISLRVEISGDAGLLYVNNPTWDEYAVLGQVVPRSAVEEALARSAQRGERPSVEDFVAPLPNVPRARRSPGPEL